MKRIMLTLGAVLIAALLSFATGSRALAQGSMPMNSATWFAEYWNNTEHAGTSAATRLEVGLSNDWGYGSPVPNMVFADHISARFNTVVNLTAGEYRFTTLSDDGIRVWIDGVLVLDDWELQTRTTNTFTRYLPAGDHPIRVDWYEFGGEAAIAIGWENLSQPGQPAPPASGWYGEYFNNTTQTGTPALVRFDPEISFNWGFGTPAPGINADLFSVRWTRTLNLEPGTYRFTMTVDDGGRLFVGGRLLLDRYLNQPATTYVADYTHPGGNVEVRMEYYENILHAVASLSWQRITPGGAPIPVPDAGQPGVCGATYTVAPGDTMYRIAAKCGVTFQALWNANLFIADPSVIRTGMVLTIPR